MLSQELCQDETPTKAVPRQRRGESWRREAPASGFMEETVLAEAGVEANTARVLEVPAVVATKEAAVQTGAAAVVTAEELQQVWHFAHISLMPFLTLYASLWLCL